MAILIRGFWSDRSCNYGVGVNRLWVRLNAQQELRPKSLSDIRDLGELDIVGSAVHHVQDGLNRYTNTIGHILGEDACIGHDHGERTANPHELMA